MVERRFAREALEFVVAIMDVALAGLGKAARLFLAEDGFLEEVAGVVARSDFDGALEDEDFGGSEQHAQRPPWQPAIPRAGQAWQGREPRRGARPEHDQDESEHAPTSGIEPLST